MDRRAETPKTIWVPALGFTSLLIIFFIAAFFYVPSMTADQRDISARLFALLCGFSSFFLGGTALFELNVPKTKAMKLSFSASAGIAVFAFTYTHPPYWFKQPETGNGSLTSVHELHSAVTKITNRYEEHIALLETNLSNEHQHSVRLNQLSSDLMVLLSKVQAAAMKGDTNAFSSLEVAVHLGYVEPLVSFLEKQAGGNARLDLSESVRLLFKSEREAKLLKLESYALDKGVPSFGNRSAELELYLFEDFQCPFSARNHDTIRQLTSTFSNRIRCCFINFPLAFHPNAYQAAQAGLAADRQGAFWPMRSKLYNRSKELSVSNFTILAAELNLDTVRFSSDFQSLEISNRVREDVEFGESLGVRSTPTCIINGQSLVGALPMDQFLETLSQQLAGHNVQSTTSTRHLQ